MATISAHPLLVLLGLQVVPVSNHLGIEQGLLVEDVLDVSCLRCEQLHKQLGIFKSQVTNPSILAPNPGLFTQVLSEIELEIPGKRFQTFYK